jgi:hypothetical protein
MSPLHVLPHVHFFGNDWIYLSLFSTAWILETAVEKT